MGTFEVYQELRSTTEQRYVVEAENEEEALDGLTDTTLVTETTEAILGEPPIERTVSEIDDETAAELRAEEPTLEERAEALKQEYGGVWGEHPDWPVSDWQREASENKTRLGYWEWAAKRERYSYDQTSL